MHERWTRLSDACAFVSYALSLDLSKASSLELIKSKFTEITGKWSMENPFIHPRRRFPAEVSKYGTVALWVNFDDSPLCVAAERILTGTDGGIAMNASAGSRRDTVSEGKTPADKKIGTDEATYGLHKTLGVLATMLKSRSLYYDLDKFEKQEGLTWGDSLPSTSTK
jgi:hypothetical protein